MAKAKTLTVSFKTVTYQNRSRALIKLINQYRKKNGLGELIMAADLEKAAVQRAAELFVLFDHDRPDLSGYETACQEDVKKYQAVTECIAAGYAKADEVFADWKRTASSSLLDSDFTHAGVGCVYMKDSANEYYWELCLMRTAAKAAVTKAAASAKAGAGKNVQVAVARGMYERADASHRCFELRADDLTLKTKSSAQPSVWLYDKYGVKIGKCALEDLTYTSGSPSVFTVLKDGTVKKKKAGSGKLKIKATGLEAQCTVTVGAAAASGGGVTKDTIREAQPTLSKEEFTKHTSLSVFVKGASGYVLCRSATKTGRYTKCDEQATTKRWTLKLEHELLKRPYYYKVRAYKNAGGKRTYSLYSDAVRVEP